MPSLRTSVGRTSEFRWPLQKDSFAVSEVSQVMIKTHSLSELLLNSFQLRKHLQVRKENSEMKHVSHADCISVLLSLQRRCTLHHLILTHLIWLMARCLGPTLLVFLI